MSSVSFTLTKLHEDAGLLLLEAEVFNYCDRRVYDE